MLSMIAGMVFPVLSSCDIHGCDLEQAIDAQPLPNYYDALSTLPVAIVNQLLGTPMASRAATKPDQKQQHMPLPVHHAAGSDVIADGQLNTGPNGFLSTASAVLSNVHTMNFASLGITLRSVIWEDGGGGLLLASLLLYLILLSRVSLPAARRMLMRPIPTGCCSSVGFFIWYFFKKILNFETYTLGVTEGAC